MRKLDTLQELISLQVRKILREGGWTSLKTQQNKLTPMLLKSADEFTRKLIGDFNSWLATKQPELPPLNPVRPVGSGIYYEKDIEEDPGKAYGDIDFLVEYPVLPATDNARKNETTSTKFYNKKLFEFLREVKPTGVEIEESKGDGGMVAVIIAEVEPEKWVQIDFMVTHKDYSGWALKRFTPIRNIKGFITGSLYTSLADALLISMGERGVRAKLRNGVLVPYNLRKDTKEHEISLQFDSMFQDILDFLVSLKHGESKAEAVTQAAGISVDNLSIESIVLGIQDLASALDSAGIFDGQIFEYTSSAEFLASFKTFFNGRMDKMLNSKKFEKADTEMAMNARDKVFKTARDAKQAVADLLG